MIRETVENDEAPAVADDENKPEEVPQSEVEKGKEGEPTEVEEPEDKVEVVFSYLIKSICIYIVLL